jgi:plasmid stabilization system protein ParE
MDFRIVWTAPALEDLEALVRYIAEDDVTAAVRVGDKIVDHVSVLASFPEIGPVYRRRATGDVQTNGRPPALAKETGKNTCQILRRDPIFVLIH